MSKQPHQETEFVTLAISEVGPAIGFSQRTAYNRINEYGWEKFEDNQKKVWVKVPKAFVINDKFVPEPVQDEPPVTQPTKQYATPPSSLVGQSTDAAVHVLQEQYEARLQDKDSLLDIMTKRVEDLEDQVTSLNHELASRNTQLQKYRSQEDQLQDIADALDKISARQKPWWQFWS